MKSSLKLKKIALFKKWGLSLDAKSRDRISKLYGRSTWFEHTGGTIYPRKDKFLACQIRFNGSLTHD